MNEAAIRDLLVDQLDCLEAGLVLLKKEQYIPSDKLILVYEMTKFGLSSYLLFGMNY